MLIGQDLSTVSTKIVVARFMLQASSIWMTQRSLKVVLRDLAPGNPLGSNFLNLSCILL